MEKISVRITGKRPLLVHSPNQMIEARDTGKQPTRSARPDTIPIVQEAEGCLYKDREGKLVVPALCILASMRNAGVNRIVPGKGKKTFKGYIFSGVQIEPNDIPLQSATGWVPDVKRVKKGNAYVPAARPRFDEWALEFEMQIVDPIISTADLKEILTDAGKYNGLCDFRPLYGLFDVERFEELKKAK